MKKEVAECIGLWLAEGDNKSNGEITFTNNCPNLIKHFHNNISNLFKNYNYNKRIRLYVYTPKKSYVNTPIKNIKIKRYIDIRANKPYFIWRLASVELIKGWKNIINNIPRTGIIYSSILRGFFAGEGNIKSSSHKSRIIRMAQAKHIELIEKALEFFNIEYVYSNRHCEGYMINKKRNWDKLAKIKIADLHPQKKKKFWYVFNDFKEEHYDQLYLKHEIPKRLNNKYYSALELSKEFDRSQDRISEVLTDLKKESIVKNFRVRSKDYWVLKKENKILISNIKYKYLIKLKQGLKRTNDISKELRVTHRSSFRRLNELEKLKLIKRNKNKTWEIIPSKKNVVVLS